MRAFIVALTLFGITSPSLAQTQAICKIDGIRTGWNDDSFAITCDPQIIIGDPDNSGTPIENPAGCHIPDGYLSHASFPGYNTYYQAALEALRSSRYITVVVHNTECGFDHPKIIGIAFGRRWNRR